MSYSKNHNIYEIRSNDVQEVMNKPPGRLVTWGNTIIFFTLIIGFSFLAMFKLPVTDEIPFQISQISHLSKTKLTIDLNVHNNMSGMPDILFPTNAKLLLGDYSSDKYGPISAVIDSVSTEGHHNNIHIYLTISADSNVNAATKNISPGMTGRLEIITGTESLIKKLNMDSK